MKTGHASRREKNGSTRIDAGSRTDVHSGGYGSWLAARFEIKHGIEFLEVKDSHHP